MTTVSQPKTVTLGRLRQMAQDGEKIACLTAYEAGFARVLDASGIDLVLVGDSLGMVVQGHRTTIPVTMDDMVYHCACVARGLKRAFLVADLPFMSYPTPALALANAARLLQAGGARMVKLEGGAAQAEIVQALVGQGIPVCAHLGLQPQSIHKLGGYRVQGKDADSASRLQADAETLAAAGADLLVLECIPATLASAISTQLAIPTIGIGAGPNTHGQILVLHDLLGITPGGGPRFARNFMQAGDGGIAGAVVAYVDAVKQGRFPSPDETF